VLAAFFFFGYASGQNQNYTAERFPEQEDKHANIYKIENEDLAGNLSSSTWYECYDNS
jgi:hypothetical protein